MACVIDTARKIVETCTAKRVKFMDGTSLKLDLYTASAIVKVFDAINDKNKAMMKIIANVDKAGFAKLTAFCFSNVK